MSSSTKAVLLKLSSGEVLICKVGLPDAAGAFQPVADWTEVVGRVDVDVLELEDVLMLQYTMQPQQQGGQAAPNISISFVPWMAKKARMRASTITLGPMGRVIAHLQRLRTSRRHQAPTTGRLVSWGAETRRRRRAAARHQATSSSPRACSS